MSTAEISAKIESLSKDPALGILCMVMITSRPYSLDPKP